MKLVHKLSWVVFACVLVLSACKEDNPGIILEKSAVTFSDTTYIGQSEAPQPKGVLVEDFTGVRCKNCPKGHEAIEVLRNKYPGRVAAFEIHAANEYQNFTTPFMGEADLRVPYGTPILDIVGRASGLPYGTIDRVLKSGTAGTWETLVLQRMGITSPVNLYIIHEYNDVSRELKVKVKAVFTDSLGTTPFFSIGITESGIKSPQQDEASSKPNNIEPEYVHNYVLRNMPAFKQNLLPVGSALPEKNRVVEKSFTITLNSDWEANNCDIVFLVHRDTEILNVIEAKVK